MHKGKRIKTWQKDVHRVAVEHGWWKEGEERPAAEQFLNVISEVCEAWEEYRSRGFSVPVYWDYEKPDGIGIELADAVIRILDICEAHDIDLEQLMEYKHAYNKTRPYRHGNKLG